MTGRLPSQECEQEAFALSVCIATFNRSEYLPQTLDSIVPQLTAGVELVIVDGASTDRTAEAIAPYVENHPGIRYYCEETNSGVDQDFDKAVGYAKGEYVWLMTDDDLLVPNAVEAVLLAISDGDEVVVLNAEVANADFSKVLNPSLMQSASDRRFDGGERERFFLNTMQCLTYIGSAVVRRSFWERRDRASYYGSLFIHVGVIFQSPVLVSMRTVGQPLIRIRYGNAMWSARSLEVWLFKWPALVHSFDAYDDQSKQLVVAREPWRTLSKLVQYRAKNAFNYRSYRLYLADKPGWLFKLCAKTISVLPLAATNLLAIAYLHLKGGSNLTSIYDLANSQPIQPIRRWLLGAYRL